MIAAAWIVSSCVPPIQPGETSTSAAGDIAETRAFADQLYLSASADPALLESNRIECDKVGGHYSRQGMAGGYMCVLSYSDAGKFCNKADDCIGQCRVTGDFSAASGRCQADTVPFGCYATIDAAGQVGPALCVD